MSQNVYRKCVKITVNLPVLGGLSYQKPSTATCLQRLEGGLFAEPPPPTGDAFLHRSVGLLVVVVDRLRGNKRSRKRSEKGQETLGSSRQVGFELA